MSFLAFLNRYCRSPACGQCYGSTRCCLRCSLTPSLSHWPEFTQRNMDTRSMPTRYCFCDLQIIAKLLYFDLL